MNKLKNEESFNLINIDPLILEIENGFDSYNRELFERKVSCSLPKEEEIFWVLYLALWDKDYSKVFELGSTILNSDTSLDRKSFSLQAIIAASEIVFDLSMRKKWMKQWNQLLNIPQNSYSNYIYLHQRAHEFYFNKNLNSAIKHFQKALIIAEYLNYQRGIYRIKFFLALAQKECGFIGSSMLLLEESQLLAQRCNAIRFIERISFNIMSAKDEVSFLTNQNQWRVFNYIKTNHIRRAKRETLHRCKVRRYEDRKWGAESEWMLLAWIAFAEKKLNRFFTILDLMDNDDIRFRTLKTAERISPDLARESIKFKHYLVLNKIHDTENDSTLPQTNYGITNMISNGAINEVHSLISYLKSNPNGISKDHLCQQLWNYSYDPTIHDQRLYILISKARNFLGSKKAIINSYGGHYKLNEALL